MAITECIVSDNDDDEHDKTIVRHEQVRIIISV